MACEQVVAAVGPRGSIGLVGDSVLLGSNDGMSNPGLPTLLKAAGWGPIRMTTTLGMRVRNNSNQSASAYHVLSRWKTAGFNPSVIAVNVGYFIVDAFHALNKADHSHGLPKLSGRKLNAFAPTQINCQLKVHDKPL